MFEFTLTLSVILVVAAHVSATRHPKPVRWAVFILVATVLNFLGIIIFPIALWLLTVALFVALLAWSAFRGDSRWFLPYSAIAVIAAYAWPVAIGLRYQAEADNLRTKYPTESMDARIPEPLPEYRLSPLPENTSTQLEALESAMGSSPRTRTHRENMLRQLHVDRLYAFVNSPGFGVMRMSVPDWSGVHVRREEGELSQPGHRSGADEWLKSSTALNQPTGLKWLHDLNVYEFVNPDGFGIVDNRKKVTGFVSHGYAKLPVTNDGWDIATVELMGLLLKPEPAVYISPRLPAMDELKGAPTRKPDDFESAALERIKKGDDLVTAETQDGTRMRMLGSIRNGKTCQKCHGGERGDLLGAFSYILSRK